jgi:hypothetical protein
VQQNKITPHSTSIARSTMSGDHTKEGIPNKNLPKPQGGQQQQPDKQQEHGPQSSTQFTNVGLEDLRQQLEVFAADRHWQQFHTPRNLLMALVGEVSSCGTA